MTQTPALGSAALADAKSGNPCGMVGYAVSWFAVAQAKLPQRDHLVQPLDVGLAVGPMPGRCPARGPHQPEMVVMVQVLNDALADSETCREAASLRDSV